MKEYKLPDVNTDSIDQRVNRGIVQGIESISIKSIPNIDLSNHPDPLFVHGFHVGLSRFNNGPYKDMDHDCIANLLYFIVIQLDLY